MKTIIFMCLLVLVNVAGAENLQIGKDEAVEIYAKTKSIEVNNIPIPIAYGYHTKDAMGLCAIANAKNTIHALVIVDNGGERFPLCAGLKDPIITKIDQNFYATYVYYVKDLSDVPIRTAYQPVKLSKDGFYQCKEEEQITDAIERNLKSKMSLQKAVDRAIQKVGCTVVQ
jgi:hypothetical protein